MQYLLWIKSLHIFFVISWFAGLFYLPRILVNLAQETDSTSTKRLLLMARKLYRYHHACGSLLKKFEIGRNAHSHVWYRWFNEVPTLVLLAIVILVVVRPF